MRLALIAALSTACPLVAAADATPAYRVFEDGSLGMKLPDKRLLGADKGLEKTLTACITGAPAAKSSALYWLEISKAGTVTVAKVRGSGSSALDGCLADGMKKASITEKLPGPIVVVGRIDILDRASTTGAYLASPRISDVAVMIDPKGAAWQLSTRRLAYTANRAGDIAQALDAQAVAIAACAAKRPTTRADVDLIAWTDGKAIVRGSGDATYDACLGRALDAIKLPTGESAVWLELSLRKPAEPLAPRTDKVALSKERALEDALTTAVRSRKAVLLTCLDKAPKTASLTKVTIALAAGKASIKTVATGDAAADTCVRGKLKDVVIKTATPTDKLELEVTLEPAT